MKGRLTLYIGIVFGVTLGLYLITHVFAFLDTAYFKSHESDLTVAHTFNTSDGYVTNYTYLHTPYYFGHSLFAFLSAIAPTAVVVYLSILLIQTQKKKTYEYLYLPLVYSVISVGYFFAVMDKSLGWEYEIGMILMFGWLFFICFVTFLLHHLIWYRKKRRAEV